MSQKTSHNVVVVIAATAVLRVDADFNEQGAYLTTHFPEEGSTAPFLFSASPIGVPLQPNDASAVSRAALVALAQKIQEALGKAELQVNAAVPSVPLLPPPSGEMN